MRAAIGLGVAALLALAAPTAACGPETDCVVGDRTYRIAVPEGDGPFGVILFLHGYQGRAADAMNYKGLREAAASVNAALIAPQGISGSWRLRNTPEGGVTSDEPEMADMDAILADAAARFPLDRTRTLATGFSAGAMAVWTLACRRGAEFAGFMPISGTFWAPLPTDCTNGPVNLLHVHGTADKTVPLAGRRIRTTAQGDVRAAWDGFRVAGDFAAPGPVEALPGLDCTGAAEEGGHRMILCLHPGGHQMDPQWISAAYRLFVP